MVDIFPVLWGTSILISMVAASVCTLTNNTWGFPFPHIFISMFSGYAGLLYLWIHCRYGWLHKTYTKPSQPCPLDEFVLRNVYEYLENTIIQCVKYHIPTCKTHQYNFILHKRALHHIWGILWIWSSSPFHFFPFPPFISLPFTTSFSFSLLLPSLPFLPFPLSSFLAYIITIFQDS